MYVSFQDTNLYNKVERLKIAWHFQDTKYANFYATTSLKIKYVKYA